MAPTDIRPLTETEEMLAGDKKGEGVKALVSQFAAAETQVKRQADAGLSPGEFRKAEAVLGGLDAAKGVAARAWAQLNKD